MSKFLWSWDDTVEWLDVKDAYLSAGLAKPSAKVLEIGVWKGGWICSVLANSEMTYGYAVDPYPNLPHIRQVFKENIERKGLGNRISLFNSTTELDHNIFYDLIHVDGEHSEEGTFRDLKFAAAQLNVGGCVVVDDIFYREFPGVASAIFRFTINLIFPHF